MISIKRMLYVIVIVILVSTIFMIYNINEEKETHVKIEQKEVEKVSWIDNENVNFEALRKDKIIVTGIKKDEELYHNIYKNVIGVLNDLKIPYEEMNHVDFEKMDKKSVIIFCTDQVNPYIDFIELGQFIENGGKIILAAGLAESNLDSYLTPYLGIIEKSRRENYNTFTFENEFWPCQKEEMKYDGYNMSTWIKVRKDAKIYIKDKETGVPVVYNYSYKKGVCSVINSTLLADKECIGVLTGSISSLYDDFLYPIVGVKSVFLDNFPMVTYVDDEQCMKLYGRDTESFVRDVVWPQFQGMGLRTQTSYSSTILVEHANTNQFPELRDSLFSTIGKSALQHSGEVLYGAYENGKGYGYFYNTKFLEEFKKIFYNYKVQGMAVMSNHFHEDMLDIPNTNLHVVRVPLEDKKSFTYNEHYFCFPECTQGNNMDKGNLFKIYSLQAMYGMLSHTFDINTLIAEDSDVPSWDRDKKQLSNFEKDVLRKMDYLPSKTLSHTENYMKSYVDLNYDWWKKGKKIYIKGNHMMQNQSFFYHTTSKIVKGEGIEFTDIGNGYYLLKMKEDEVSFIIE